MKICRAATVAFCGIFLGTIARAQDDDLMPRELRKLAEGQLGVIDDLQVSGFGTSSSISITNENGVKTTKVADGTNRMTIIEDPASGITCKVTKYYGPDDLDKLEEEQPELFMHLSSIPKTINDSQIELNVGVTSSYTAADKAELKSKHPDIYKLYNKYTKAQNIGIMRLGRPLRFRLDARGGAMEGGFGAPMDDDDEGDEDGDDDESDDDDGEDDDSDDGDDDGEDDGR